MDGAWQLVVALAAAMAMCPFAFFWGCLPCCQGGCGLLDGKDRTDPKNEGTWVPSGTWSGVGSVTWTFTANPGDDSGETWFFYGSTFTSKADGVATLAERQDWGNICNWYSNKTTSPSTLTGFPGAFNRRATRLPPVDAVVHIYSDVSTVTAGPQTVKYAYFWSSSNLISGSEITSTAAAHDSVGGAVFNDLCENLGTVNGGATFNDISLNSSGGIVNDGATFNNSSDNSGGTVNDGATFNDNARNLFSTFAGTLNGGATFNDTSENRGTVNGGATFNDNAEFSLLIVNGGATFNDNAEFSNGTVNGGATFNDSSVNNGGTVNDGATFNDAACSTQTTGNFFSVPCDRKFVAHPTDLPTCNGTAPDGCANSADTCGCG